MPTGDLANSTSTGFNVNAFASINPPFLQYPPPLSTLGYLGLRIDGLLSQLPAAGGATFDQQVVGATADLTFPTLANNVFRGWWLGAYVAGGAGYYTTKLTPNGASSSDLGWNAGITVEAIRRQSVQQRGFAILVEARMHRISTLGAATTMVPISLGIQF